MDESGDLGFDFKKKKTSRYFVVTFIFTEDKTSLDKIIKKIFAGFSKKEVKNHAGELHAYKELVKTRKKVLNMFHDKKAAHILLIYVDKKKVYAKLKDQKHILYNYITNILLDRICTKKLIPLNKKIKIIASRRETNKFLNANFSSYIKDQTQNKHKLDLEIDIAPPAKEKGLQIADMISWSVFRKYEHEDDTYYNIIKDEIVEENPLFK
jgi:hypothetical protein